MGLFNRRKLPAANRPALDRDERVLAWARVADGDGVVVVTNAGLWLPGRGHRLGWHDLHKAVWSGRELSVTPAERVAERDGYLVAVDSPVETYLLPDPGQVPHQVRTRLTRSVAYTEHHAVPGGGVRVVARRVVGVDGLTWTVRYDPGTPADEPAVVAATDDLVSAARAATAPAADTL
ncbi:hypothetical protein [Micromonospora echinofusca]|uniref:DUF4178 domain-containing protein n=1 Tax=Micromonospora echinofusca TaxID=47858 RepID=A0ABS3W0X0_MICEH|nr:hypothetical protein [Micromonospora echinofusca]MBO4210371.1 hypothetical protein [Micromonospora echinofusca]